MIANKSWADMTVLAGGVPFLEIQEIGYNRERKIEDHYGAGPKVVSRGYGNVEDNGLTFKMSFDELKRLELAAPGGDITLIPPFPVSVVWKPTAQNPVSFTDTLTNCQFTSNGRDLKQGDTKHFTTIKGIFAGFNDPQ
jgi:hypothetical protein